MEVYRIAHSGYCRDLSGRGAEINGGRWNEVGIPALYASTNRALTALEILANINNIPHGVSYSLVTLRLPEINEYPKIQVSELSKNWNRKEYLLQTLKIGSDWLRNRTSLILAMPSSLVFEEYNVLINPYHPDATKMSIINVREFEFDQRLLR